MKLIIALIKSARPRQWLKNLSLFAAIVFEGSLLDPVKFGLVSQAVIIFCILTSSVYLTNDVIDIKRDQLHPFKRKRPVASGQISRTVALSFALSGLMLALIWSSVLSIYFTMAILGYAFLQVAYSLFLKKIILLDVMAIATGFLLRVYAGALIINAHITVWFLLAVVSLSLFLAVGKRQSERTLLLGGQIQNVRSTLLKYPPALLDSLTVMFATASWLSYTMFTFLQPSVAASNFLLIDFLPRTLANTSKLLMITVPFVIYGVMRYLYIIYEKKEGESPERVLLSDSPLLITVTLWGLSLLLIIYGIGYF